MSIFPKAAACLFLTFAHSLTASGEAAGPGAVSEAVSNQTNVLFDFAAEARAPVWVVVNDDVMGGVSRGNVDVSGGLLRFRGVLSLENNGGFSSIRARGTMHDLSAITHLVLRVKGDGRTYRVTLGTNAEFRRSRISYQAEFSTRKGEWSEVRVPLAKFGPTHHGESLSGPPLDQARIQEFGIQLSDGQPGPFSLEVAWIRGE